MDEDDVALSDYEGYNSEDEDLVMSSEAESAILDASDADEAAFGNVDDLNFSQELDKTTRRPWEVEFRVLDVPDIINAQRKEVEQVASMFVIQVRAYQICFPTLILLAGD